MNIPGYGRESIFSLVENAKEDNGTLVLDLNFDGEAWFCTTYYRYDDAGQLHLIRYVEVNGAEDALFNRLDLTYVEDDGPYTLEATADEERQEHILVSMAKQALSELYEWTGEKVETACFRASNIGSVVFACFVAQISKPAGGYDGRRDCNLVF